MQHISIFTPKGELQGTGYGNPPVIVQVHTIPRIGEQVVVYYMDKDEHVTLTGTVYNVHHHLDGANLSSTCNPDVHVYVQPT